ncbi:MAG TPA: hypothetical protein VOA87_13080 [Thermoanaerobaculia bacterium]|nr:hypothetical protein [Thermoanaerobaculia bacterium]
MPSHPQYVRLNIYLDQPELHRAIKIAAARKGVTLSAYCLEALRDRLAEEDHSSQAPAISPRDAAKALDRLRNRIGPIGVPVHELIAEGRRR